MNESNENCTKHGKRFTSFVVELLKTVATSNSVVLSIIFGVLEWITVTYGIGTVVDSVTIDSDSVSRCSCPVLSSTASSVVSIFGDDSVIGDIVSAIVLVTVGTAVLVLGVGVVVIIVVGVVILGAVVEVVVVVLVLDIMVVVLVVAGDVSWVVVVCEIVSKCVVCHETVSYNSNIFLN